MRACRPRQWTKNVLVAAAPAAAGVITRPSAVREVAAAFVSFCAVSSATYLINDVRDREEDRHHPRKRLRPIAAGEISTRAALLAASAIGAGGLLLAAVAARPLLAVVELGYLGLTVSYSLLWRHIVIADIAAIAAGFVLRTVAGGVAVDVPLSRSFLIVVSAGAVFLVAGKRYAELLSGAAHANSRTTLHTYSEPVLRAVLLAAAALAAAAYGAFAFTRDHPGPWLQLSLAPLVAWLWRYARLLAGGAGQAPEELILRDRVLLALTLGWAVLFLTGIYAGS